MNSQTSAYVPTMYFCNDSDKPLGAVTSNFLNPWSIAMKLSITCQKTITSFLEQCGTHKMLREFSAPRHQAVINIQEVLGRTDHLLSFQYKLRI
jgi:hypothetical protein